MIGLILAIAISSYPCDARVKCSKYECEMSVIYSTYTSKIRIKVSEDTVSLAVISREGSEDVNIKENLEVELALLQSLKSYLFSVGQGNSDIGIESATLKKLYNTNDSDFAWNEILKLAETNETIADEIIKGVCPNSANVSRALHSLARFEFRSCEQVGKCNGNRWWWVIRQKQKHTKASDI